MLKLLDSVKYRYSFPLNLDNGLRTCYILIPMCIQSYCQSMMKGCIRKSNLKRMVFWLQLSEGDWILRVSFCSPFRDRNSSATRSTNLVKQSQSIKKGQPQSSKKSVSRCTWGCAVNWITWARWAKPCKTCVHQFCWTETGDYIFQLIAWMFVGIKEAMKGLE